MDRQEETRWKSDQCTLFRINIPIFLNVSSSTLFALWFHKKNPQSFQTWDSSRSRSTGESGRGDLRGKGCDSSGVRRGFSVPSSSLRYIRLALRGRSAVVSSSPGLSLILCGPGGGGGRNGAGGGSGGAGGGPGAGAVPSTGRGGGRGEEVRDTTRGEQVRERGSGEQVRDGGVGVEGRDIEGGGERLLRRPHCSLFSLLLMVGRTWRITQFVAPLVPVYKLSTATSSWCFCW